MAEYEKQSIDEILQGDGNVFYVIGRVYRALKQSGCTKDYLDEFSNKAYDFHSYQEVINYCSDTLEEAGFRWGERELTEEEVLIDAIYSGKYDGLTISELKQKLNLDNYGYQE